MSSTRQTIKNFYAIGTLTGAVTPALNAKVDGDMSADITGPTTDASMIDSMMYQVKWASADAIGVIAFQVSTDGTQWDDLTLPGLQQPNSDSAQYSLMLNVLPNTLIRPIYRRTSGSGRLEIRLSAKGD